MVPIFIDSPIHMPYPSQARPGWGLLLHRGYREASRRDNDAMEQTCRHLCNGPIDRAPLLHFDVPVLRYNLRLRATNAHVFEVSKALSRLRAKLMGRCGR